MKIAIDLDGVICDIVLSIMKSVEDKYNVRIYESWIFDHNLSSVFGISEIEKNNIIHKSIFQEHLAVVGALEGLSKLKRKHDLQILTSRGLEYREGTKKWLHDKGLKNIKISFQEEWQNKEDHFDIVIDDRPEKLASFADKAKYLILFFREWNKNCLDIKEQFIVVDNWDDLMLTIDRIVDD